MWVFYNPFGKKIEETIVNALRAFPLDPLYHIFGKVNSENPQNSPTLVFSNIKRKQTFL